MENIKKEFKLVFNSGVARRLLKRSEEHTSELRHTS